MYIFTPEFILSSFLIFVRMSGLLMTAPFLGSAFFPTRIKLFFAIAVTIVIAPVVPLEGAAIAKDIKVLALVLAIVQETLIGVAMGLVGLIIFGGVQMAGQFVSIQTGLGFANIVDPQSQEQNAVISQIFTLLGVILFLAIGGEATYLRAAVHSFEAIPIGTASYAGAAPTLITMATQVFIIGVQLSAPFLVVLFLLDLSFAIFARIMPQANIFFIALPLKIFGGLIMLLLIVPKLGIAFNQYFQILFDFLLDLMKVLR